MLEIQGLSKTYGNNVAVDNVSFSVPDGQVGILLGPNGAGKTTVFNIITGVYKATSGHFYLDGEDLTNKSQEYICHKGIARTFQNIRLFNNMTVIRNVLVGLHSQKEYAYSLFDSILRLPRFKREEKEMRDKAKELLAMVDLLDVRNDISSNLPYGKQRKLEIARALATEPKLLCLDEPAAGMNPQETKELMDIIFKIRDLGITILLIEHDMKFVSGLCDEVTVLDFGHILASGKTKEVLNDPEVVRAYIGG